ncbi:unnamed protein product [Effrenium voratum]|uniref:Uncharacterized protein n=1 Tax=Effrenium voratum TaxID=2562239 RepID=A0AA36JKU5_9DINO|nr:unnamed protein product [Effrenium voratum]
MQEKRWRMPHLRLPQVRLGKTKGLTKAQAKTAMKAVPVLAAAAAEIPAVREQLRQWVGQDVAPHVLAQQTLWRAKSEAQRLGQQAADSARAASRQLQSMGHGIMNELKEVNKEVDETVIKAEHAAEELLHIKHEEQPRLARTWLFATVGCVVGGAQMNRGWWMWGLPSGVGAVDLAPGDFEFCQVVAMGLVHHFALEALLAGICYRRARRPRRLAGTRASLARRGSPPAPRRQGGSPRIRELVEELQRSYRAVEVLYKTCRGRKEQL